jgi:predicted membrane protein
LSEQQYSHTFKSVAIFYEKIVMIVFLSFLPLIIATLFIAFAGYLIIGHELSEEKKANAITKDQK